MWSLKKKKKNSIGGTDMVKSRIVGRWLEKHGLFWNEYQLYFDTGTVVIGAFGENPDDATTQALAVVQQQYPGIALEDILRTPVQ